MTTLESFPAIESAESNILILGSMPGVDSLKASQYYAHRQNAFWFIMGELFGAGFDLAYGERVDILVQHKIALWDVLHQCRREGSLDSSIRDERVNDIEQFVVAHGQLRLILFNGKKSEQIFRKQVSFARPEVLERIQLLSMPSTSPAMATLSKYQKLEIWRAALLPDRHQLE